MKILKPRKYNREVDIIACSAAGVSPDEYSVIQCCSEVYAFGELLHLQKNHKFVTLARLDRKTGSSEGDIYIIADFEGQSFDISDEWNKS